eukprot:1555246-Prorocentrum_lima.AAC.1
MGLHLHPTPGLSRDRPSQHATYDARRQTKGQALGCFKRNGQAKCSDCLLYTSPSPRDSTSS